MSQKSRLKRKILIDLWFLLGYCLLTGPLARKLNGNKRLPVNLQNARKDVIQPLRLPF